MPSTHWALGIGHLMMNDELMTNFDFESVLKNLIDLSSRIASSSLLTLLASFLGMRFVSGTRTLADRLSLCVGSACADGSRAVQTEGNKVGTRGTPFSTKVRRFAYALNYEIRIERMTN
jgi:hypothetical protein